MVNNIKERLVGAVVLILIMVVVVPIFLDGQDTRTIEKSLISNVQKNDKDRQIITLNLDRNTPIPINEDRDKSLYMNKFNNLYNKTRNKIKSFILDDKEIISNQLNNEVDNFAIDLIANTYEKNEQFSNLNLFLKKISAFKPLWIEEILKTDKLFQFKKIEKYGLKFSYGENFNTYIDFINLIEFYKFNYVNPDLSHLSIFDFNELNRHLISKKKKNKIIIHCWGGAINFIFSLYCAQVFSQQVKLVEFPITDSNFMNKVYPNIYIKNSICSIDENVKSFKDIIDIKKLEKIKSSKLTFNFN